ncbi:hyaluronan-binding protein 2-like [Cheilinus undulatus]|uniref:hyaluronan-binding protein 2-like n=1 Tax=Cheilinus undulatus TaxID=241271 RepID=UPI001BD6DD9B|nr:hyaluronan-binding protein 2-like [Cheilinus undulatus]
MLAAGVLLISLCLLGVHGNEADEIVKITESETSTNSTNDLQTDVGDWLVDLVDDAKVCDPNPCLNGGTCHVESDLSLTCTCPEPYVGKRCQSVANICKNVTCGHGDCVIDLKNPPFYECKCNPPYQGPHCSSLPESPCDPNPCQNGGTCLVEKGHFGCACPSGYTGRFCQSAPTDCYEGEGESYKGNVSTTDDGLDCLDWNSYFILAHDRNPFTMFKNFSEEENNNHCRNPDGDHRPWCYIKKEGRLDWDYCKVQKCPEVHPVPHPSMTPVPPVPDPSPFSQCGRLSPNLLSSIVKGSVASRGHHPWQVSLQKRFKGFPFEFSHYCGGTLISSCWVLTAAHCISDRFDYQVMLGGLNIHKHEASEQIIPVIETIVHEDYRDIRIASYNDIALVKLNTTEGNMCAKETDFVKTACLPDQVFPAKTECVISGWGDTKEGDRRGSNTLLKAKVLLISESKCNQTQVYDGLLDDGMLCAGSLQGGVDSCQGDSGGPLTCKQDGTHYISGVVSWGHGCARKNKPGIYTNVYKFVDWIRRKMN